MPKPQTRAEDQALSLRMALSAPSIPSAFGWSVTMKVGMHFDQQFFVCCTLALAGRRLVEGVLASSCVARSVGYLGARGVLPRACVEFYAQL